MKPLLPGGELGRRGAGLHPQRARGRWAWEEERQHLGTGPYAQALSRPSKFHCPWSDFVGGPRVTGRVQSRGEKVAGGGGRGSSRGGREQSDPAAPEGAQPELGEASWALGESRGSGCSRGRRKRGLGEKQKRERKAGNRQRRHGGQWLKWKDGCGCLLY